MLGRRIADTPQQAWRLTPGAADAGAVLVDAVAGPAATDPGTRAGTGRSEAPGDAAWPVPPPARPTPLQ